MNLHVLGIRESVDFTPIHDGHGTIQERRDYMLDYMRRRRERQRRRRISHLLALMDGCWPPGASIDRIFFGPDGQRPKHKRCLFCGEKSRRAVCGACRYESELRDAKVSR